MDHQLFTQLDLLTVWLIVLAGFVLRYFVIAGFDYLLFYFVIRKSWWYRKVQQVLPKTGQIRMEILWSASTFIIFAFFGLLVQQMEKHGFSLIYDSIDDYGWPWFFISIFLMLVLHDTWFYWTHRFMHWKKVFGFIHRVHHLSHAPTPWTSFSFHPVEAVIEGLIFPIIVITIPAHFYALLSFLLIMTIINVNGHLGFELFPKKFSKTFWFRVFNSTTHHDLHHRFTKGNYGLYFNVWDRIMKTNQDRYQQTFDDVHARKQNKSA